MREIMLDTETTGLSPKDGDRIVEIGCVEMINRFPTGEVYHQYVNPQRSMPKPAFDVAWSVRRVFVEQTAIC